MTLLFTAIDVSDFETKNRNGLVVIIIIIIIIIIIDLRGCKHTLEDSKGRMLTRRFLNLFTFRVCCDIRHIHRIHYHCLRHHPEWRILAMRFLNLLTLIECCDIQ